MGSSELEIASSSVEAESGWPKEYPEMSGTGLGYTCKQEAGLQVGLQTGLTFSLVVD